MPTTQNRKSSAKSAPYKGSSADAQKLRQGDRAAAQRMGEKGGRSRREDSSR